MTNGFAAPEEWNHTTIGDISHNIQYGFTESAVDEPVGPKFLRISDIQDNRVDWDTTPYCEISNDEKEKYLLKEGDILFTRTGGTVGKSFLIQGNIPEAVFASYLIRIQLAEEVNERYVYYFFKSNDYWRQISEGKKGIGQANVNSSILSEIELPLPPQREQERIVAKIEELFSKLDSGVSELEESKGRLKFYNRAVLKAAMEGKFTRKARQSIPKTGSDYLTDILEYRREKWDDEFQEVFKYSGKEYEEPESADPPEHAKIPEEWTWGTVNQISYVVGGLTKNKSKREDYSTEVPYLRVANVYANELDLDEVKTIKISEREEMTKMLKEGDLLVVEGNGSKSQIGRVALWDGSISPCSHQNHLIKVRILKEELRKFVLYWLLSPMGRNVIVDVASSTSELHTLSISKVRSIPVPIPPEEEAEKVVQEIERRTTVTDQVLKDVENELNRTDRLRQSILKHAFEGNLVPQDPTEEPPTLDGGDRNLEPGEQATLSEVISDVE